MNTPYPTTFNPASNANHNLRPSMPISFQQFTMPAQPLPQHYPYMMVPHPMQQQQQLSMQHPGYPMYAFPAHNFPLMAVRQPFFPDIQYPVAPSYQPAPPRQVNVAPSGTPKTSRTRMHNTSLNASLLAGSTSFNDSVRFNPLARGRSRDQSLLMDQTAASSDRSFQQSFTDEMINNNDDLIDYCVAELCRRELTEQELVAKVTRSRRFKKFGVHNLPAAVSIVLNTFPCFISRTMILKMSPNDPQPVSKTVWKSDKRYRRPRGTKLNATMFEIPERNTGSGEVLSVLGDIESLKLDENPEPTAVASMEKVVE